MEKSDSPSNKTMILSTGILVALYVTLQFSIYLYKPNSIVAVRANAQQIQLPKEATLLNAAMTYMVSIVGISRK
jgi:hypothetical protein